MEARLRRPTKGELGLASGSTTYIFCGRLDQVAQRVLPDSRSRLLGDVLAHEIAHLLLDPGPHASGGIMQPQWGTAELLRLEQGGLTLLPSQIDHLRCSAP